MKKILIVEDDKDIALAMSVRLRAWGYKVDTVHDAVMATTVARKYQPDMVLVDIGLPGGDGFSLVERFQSIDEVAGIPVVFITASKTPGLREKALELGAVDFIEKPFSAERFREAVVDCTEKME